MLYDVIFPVIIQVILLFLSVELILYCSFQFLYPKEARCLLTEKTEGKEKTTLCITFGCNMLCNKQHQISVSYRTKKLSSHRFVVSSGGFVPGSGPSSMCLSCQDYLGFLFSWQKAGRSEHKKQSQTMQAHLKPLLCFGMWNTLCLLSFHWSKQVIWPRPILMR